MHTNNRQLNFTRSPERQEQCRFAGKIVLPPLSPPHEPLQKRRARSAMCSLSWAGLPFTSRHPTRFAAFCSRATWSGPNLPRTPRSSSSRGQNRGRDGVRLPTVDDAGTAVMHWPHRASRSARQLRGDVDDDAKTVVLPGPHRATRPTRRLLGADDAETVQGYLRFAALPERLGDCASLTTLHLWYCRSLTALPERLGDCASLTRLDLRQCSRLPRHLDVAERLKARGCGVLLGYLWRLQ